MNPKVLSLGMPKTQLAIDAFLTVTGLATALRIPDVAARFARQDHGSAWQLPEPPSPRRPTTTPRPPQDLDTRDANPTRAAFTHGDRSSSVDRHHVADEPRAARPGRRSTGPATVDDAVP